MGRVSASGVGTEEGVAWDTTATLALFRLPCAIPHAARYCGCAPKLI